MYFSYLSYDSVSEKHEVYISEPYLTISPKCCLAFEPQDYAGLPA